MAINIRCPTGLVAMTAFAGVILFVTSEEGMAQMNASKICGETKQFESGLSLKTFRSTWPGKQEKVFLFYDHRSGRTCRSFADSLTGREIRHEWLPGRPQGSPAEFQFAIDAMRREASLESLLKISQELEGGFVVDGPPDSPPNNRYIQVRILSADHTRLLRVVIVDFTRELVVCSSEWF